MPCPTTCTYTVTRWGGGGGLERWWHSLLLLHCSNVSMYVCIWQMNLKLDFICFMTIAVQVRASVCVSEDRVVLKILFASFVYQCQWLSAFCSELLLYGASARWNKIHHAAVHTCCPLSSEHICMEACHFFGAMSGYMQQKKLQFTYSSRDQYFFFLFFFKNRPIHWLGPVLPS